MPTANTNIIEVESFHFTGTPDNIFGLRAWLSQWDVHTVLKDERTGAETPHIEEFANQWIISSNVLKYSVPPGRGVGKLFVHPGEVIVRYPDSFIRVMSAGTFQAVFV